MALQVIVVNNKEGRNNVQNQPSPSQNKGQSGLVWIVLTGIIGILIGAILSSQLGNVTQDVAVAPTETVLPTDIPATETVIPTDIPATATAEVTNTASPSPIPTQTASPTPTPIIISKESVVERTQKNSELVTIKAIVSTDINFGETKNILQTKYKFTVSAGIDLDDFSEKNITITTDGTYNTVTITLPPTKFIGDPSPVVDSYKVIPIPVTWDEKFVRLVGLTFSNPDINQIIQDHQKEALRRACEFGLLEFAADHARVKLRSFLFDNDPLNKYNDYIIKAPVGTCESN